MRAVQLLGLLISTPVVLAAQAPTCQPTAVVRVDTTRYDLGVRVLLAGDTVAHAALTERIGAGLRSSTFRAPPSISRIFYPGTTGWAGNLFMYRRMVRLVARVAVTPPLSGSGEPLVTLELASDDPVTDSIFVAAVREALPLVSNTQPEIGAQPLAIELVLSGSNVLDIRPLFRLAVPNVILDTPAALRRAPTPRYPGGHRSKREEGIVRLQFVVDAAGRVEPASMRVIHATSPTFAAAARESILAAEFTPARAGGCPQKQLVQQNVRFSLGGSSARLRPR